MPRSQSIQIGLVTFPSKKAAKDRVRGIIKRHQDRERITASDDDKFLRDLILLHTEVEEKVGCGVSYFTVDLEKVYWNMRHIVVVRLDGTETDASCVNNCIDGKDDRKDLMDALRHAVANEVKAFKKMQFNLGVPLVCPYLKQTLSEECCHVDHEPPHTFKSLAEEWMNQNNFLLLKLL